MKLHKRAPGLVEFKGTHPAEFSSRRSDTPEQHQSDLQGLASPSNGAVKMIAIAR
jgi:hypothetical protein